MNIYWKSGIAVVIAIAGFFAGWYVNGNRKDAEITAIKADYAEKERQAVETYLKEKKRLETAVFELSADAEKQRLEASEATSRLKQELKNAKPLSAGCRIGSDRMHIISKAVAVANGASTAVGKSGSTVPADK